MKLKVIVTGTTGMVGEGVLLECLEHGEVKQVLSVVRHPSGLGHRKLHELIVTDFLQLEHIKDRLKGFDACFFCAGVSSVGMKEPEYTRNTYDTTLNFAQTLAELNRDLVFCYVSGQGTNSSEKGKIMWARVKGKTENALMRLPLKRIYNFRPGILKPTPGQQHLKPLYRFGSKLYPLIGFFFPNSVCTLKELGRSMINSVRTGYNKQILEVNDIRDLAQKD